MNIVQFNIALFIDKCTYIMGTTFLNCCYPLAMFPFMLSERKLSYIFLFITLKTELLELVASFNVVNLLTNLYFMEIQDTWRVTHMLNLPVGSVV